MRVNRGLATAMVTFALHERQRCQDHSKSKKKPSRNENMKNLSEFQLRITRYIGYIAADKTS